MNSLGAGAIAVLHKPRGPGSPHFAGDAQQLRDTVKAMATVKLVRQLARAAGAGAPALPPRPRARRDRLIGVAASTGGPEALHCLLSRLPADFAIPILAVQHITSGFAPGLAEWLDATCTLHVKLAEQGEPLAPRTAYIAPDERHLGVTRQGTVALADTPPVGGFRPAASYLFESLAEVYGTAVTAVILTGMGSDGVEGLRASARRADGLSPRTRAPAWSGACPGRPSRPGCPPSCCRSTISRGCC